jgi:hypothetical protein
MNFTNEIERFCTYFNLLKKGSSKPGQSQDEVLAEINRQIIMNKHFSEKRTSRNFQIDKEMFDGQNIWLIKPNDFNRGRGVSLFENLS